MALIDPSTITTLGALGSTNPISAITNLGENALSSLECQAEATAQGIANAAGAIVNNAINAAENVAAGLVTSAVNSAIGAVAHTAEGAISSAINSVTGMLAADAKTIANSVSSTVGNLFSNTIGAIGTNIKLPIPDPVASAFGKGVPQSSLFATNSILSQMDSVTLGALGAVKSTAAGFLSLLNLPSQLLRYGVQTAADLEKAILGELSQMTMASSYSPLASFLTPGTSALSTAASATYAGCVCGPASYAGYLDFATLAGPIASSLTSSGDGLAGFYNPFLSASTDANGQPISGIPSNVPARTVNQITNTLSSTLGVSTVTLTATPYAAQQSLFDGLYTVSAKLGLVAVLQQMAASPTLYGPTTQAAARTLLAQTTANTDLIVTLLQAAGAQTVSLPPSWYQSLVNNTTLTVNDITNITNILNQTHVSITTIFSGANPTTLRDGVPTNNTPITIGAGGGGAATTGSTILYGDSDIAGEGGPVLGTKTSIWTTGWQDADSALAITQPPGSLPTSASGGGSGGNGLDQASQVAIQTIWNPAVLTTTQTPIATGLLSTSSATIEGATAASQPTVGLAKAATVALMARGTPRRLTRNGRFIPTSKTGTKTILYGSMVSIAS